MNQFSRPPHTAETAAQVGERSLRSCASCDQHRATATLDGTLRASRPGWWLPTFRAAAIEAAELPGDGVTADKARGDLRLHDDDSTRQRMAGRGRISTCRSGGERDLDARRARGSTAPQLPGAGATLCHRREQCDAILVDRAGHDDLCSRQA